MAVAGTSISIALTLVSLSTLLALRRRRASMPHHRLVNAILSTAHPTEAHAPHTHSAHPTAQTHAHTVPRGCSDTHTAHASNAHAHLHHRVHAVSAATLRVACIRAEGAAVAVVRRSGRGARRDGCMAYLRRLDGGGLVGWGVIIDHPRNAGIGGALHLLHRLELKEGGIQHGNDI